MRACGDRYVDFTSKQQNADFMGRHDCIHVDFTSKTVEC